MPRPRLTDKPATSLNIYLTQELYDKLFKAAQLRGVAMSEVAREAIEEKANDMLGKTYLTSIKGGRDG